MDLRSYFLSLDAEAQAKYAKKAGTTVNYIRCHLICDMPRRKTPRKKLMRGLEKASNGVLTRQNLLEYFYGVAA